jgi:hypothetical protein
MSSIEAPPISIELFHPTGEYTRDDGSKFQMYNVQALKMTYEELEQVFDKLSDQHKKDIIIDFNNGKNNNVVTINIELIIAIRKINSEIGKDKTANIIVEKNSCYICSVL